MLLFSHLVMSNPANPWTAARQTSLSLTISWSLPKFVSIDQWFHPAISSSDTLFSFCSQSFPASGTFPMSWLFSSDDQNTGASASTAVLPMNIQDLFPLGWSGWTSLLSKGLSVNTLFQQHKRRLYIWTSPDGQYQNKIDCILCSQRWRSSI